MHPHTFYSTLFQHTKRDEVFVIMSFAPDFCARWCEVIEPVIREDLGLVANRVDYNVSGESVVHDIMDGIAHARLVIADITSREMSDDRGCLWPQRNANVMWELGIAHIMRLPDEVLMVRSDREQSIFDLTQFRAFEYDPSDVDAARRLLRRLAEDRLRAIDQSKSDFVRQCTDALDPLSATFLLMRVPTDGRPFVVTPNMRNAMVVPRLFELGILRTVKHKVVPTKESGKVAIDAVCAITPLGRHVADALERRMRGGDRLRKKEQQERQFPQSGKKSSGRKDPT